MATSDLVKQLKIPTIGGNAWVDVLIGQAQWGEYIVRLFDKDGKNPILVGSGNNIDTLPDSFQLDTSNPGLAGRLLGWVITIASPEEPNGQLYYARVTVREGSTSLSTDPIEYSGELDGAKILMGYAIFSI